MTKVRVLVAPAAGVSGPPKPAEFVGERPGKPHIVKVIYEESRTAAWVLRSRIIQEESTVVGAVATAELVEVDPRKLVIDRNVRLDARLDSEFVASIAERGVLQPVVAYLRGGDLVVLYGARRTLAAVEAGRAVVPVVVVPPPDDVDRVVDQLSENDHRAGLTVAERVAAYEQLALLGVPAGDIARLTASTPAAVAAGLAIARSEKARDTADEFELTLEQAAAVAEFDGDDPAVERLVQAAEHGRFEHVAQQLRDERAEAEQRAEAVRAWEATGLRVVDQPQHGSPVRHLDALLHDGEVPTAETHAGCPGHAAYLRGVWVDEEPADPTPPAEGELDLDRALDDDEPPGRVEWQPVYVCTDPAGNGHTPRWGGSGRIPAAEKTDEQRAADAAERREVIAGNKAWDSATKVRRAWLKTLLARRTPPKGAAAFTAHALASCHSGLSNALTSGHALAHELLGAGQPGGYGERGRAIGKLLQYGEGRAQVVVLAMVLASYESWASRNSWRSVDPTVKDYLRYLEAIGYPLSDIELLACGVKPKATKAGKARPRGGGGG